MEKYCKVIFLENINGIIKIKDKNGNLFITSDEEIKDGDWFYSEIVQKIFKATNEKYNLQELNLNSCNHKIIATTNTALKVHHFNKGVFKDLEYSLPQPSQQFIQYFLEGYNKGNVITKVDVEYNPNTWKSRDFRPVIFHNLEELRNTNYDENFNFDFTAESLKINPDNTINIKPNKESWSREEVVEFGLKCVNLGMDLNNNPLPRLNEISGKEFYYKWIEENL
jgi:hypothetical protein